VYDVLRTILVDDLQLRAEDVLPGAGRAEIGLDSLAAVELVAVLRSRLGILVKDYEVLQAATVADVARLIEQRGPVSGVPAAGPRDAP
jgi:acyl carrier protein